MKRKLVGLVYLLAVIVGCQKDNPVGFQDSAPNAVSNGMSNGMSNAAGSFFSGFASKLAGGHLGEKNVAVPPALSKPLAVVDSDFNGDGQVNFSDFLAFAQAFNTNQSRFDLNKNGVVDFSDFLVFSTAFGQQASASKGARNRYLNLSGSAFATLNKSIYPITSTVQSFTAEAWIYPIQSASYILSDDAYDLILFQGDPAKVANDGLGVRANMWQDGSNGVYQTEFRGIKLNQWNHIAVIYNIVSSTYSISINGILSTNPADFASSTFFSSNNQNFAVGACTVENIGYFQGFVDEVRISRGNRYTANFTPQETFSPDTDTMGLWHFDEDTGATLFNDASGNGNTLTGKNGAVITVK